MTSSHAENYEVDGGTFRKIEDGPARVDGSIYLPPLEP